MNGLMMDFPLTISHLFGRAERYHRDKTVLTVTRKGPETVTYGEWAERTRRLGGVLDRLGLSADARVGTFAWNTARHLELYFAVPCSGRVLHTLNIRLFPEQLTYIVNHAADEAIFVDRSLLGAAGPAAVDVADRASPDRDGRRRRRRRAAGWRRPARCTTTRSCWPGRRRWRGPTSTSSRAASMCYTSGTTGNPKGALYSHRSTFLHTFGVLQADSVGCVRARRGAAGRAHVPRQRLGPRPRRGGLGRGAGHARPRPVGSGAGRPDRRTRRSRWRRGCPRSGWACCHCSRAVTPATSARSPAAARPCRRPSRRAYRRVTGKPIVQAWGMTETSPIASVFQLKSTLEGLSEDEQADLRTTVGMINFGVECRIVGDDGGLAGAGAPGARAPSSSPGTARRRASCRCAARG